MERIGERAMKPVATAICRAVVSAYNGNGDLGNLIRQASESGTAVLWSGMAATALLGRQRSLLHAERYLRNRHLARQPFFPDPTFGWQFAAITRAWSYDKAMDYLVKRQGLTPIQADEFAAKFGNESVRVMRGAAKSVERRCQTAIRQITQEGMHVREGMAHLARGLENAGVGPQNPWLLETLVRTQVNLAYSAGQEIANSDPAIDEILWGYEYSATGDDRTRPNHAALDGTRLPKDDPRWMEIAPPNGFSCRCKRIEIFKDDAKRATEREPAKGGEPDKGWAFNPSQVLSGGATVDLPKLRTVVPKPKRVTKRKPATVKE